MSDQKPSNITKESMSDYVNDISESVLDKDSSEVPTTISGFVAKKPIKRSK